MSWSRVLALSGAGLLVAAAASGVATDLWRLQRYRVPEFPGVVEWLFFYTYFGAAIVYAILAVLALVFLVGRPGRALFVVGLLAWAVQFTALVAPQAAGLPLFSFGPTSLVALLFGPGVLPLVAWYYVATGRRRSALVWAGTVLLLMVLGGPTAFLFMEPLARIGAALLVLASAPPSRFQVERSEMTAAASRVQPPALDAGPPGPPAALAAAPAWEPADPLPPSAISRGRARRLGLVGAAVLGATALLTLVHAVALGQPLTTPYATVGIAGFLLAVVAVWLVLTHRHGWLLPIGLVAMVLAVNVAARYFLLMAFLPPFATLAALPLLAWYYVTTGHHRIALGGAVLAVLATLLGISGLALMPGLVPISVAASLLVLASAPSMLLWPAEVARAAPATALVGAGLSASEPPAGGRQGVAGASGVWLGVLGIVLVGFTALIAVAGGGIVPVEPSTREMQYAAVYGARVARWNFLPWVALGCSGLSIVAGMITTNQPRVAVWLRQGAIVGFVATLGSFHLVLRLAGLP